MSRSLLSLHEVSKGFGQPLLDDLTLTVHQGERLGVIGRNGAGKSTLLRILAGLEAPDGGRRVLGQGLRLAYVAQEEDFDLEGSVADAVRKALQDEPLDEVQRETRTQIVLGKVGFEDPDQTVGALSGGWRKRLALACALALEPDLVLLDEPTNHLDIAGIEWLEGLLKSEPFAWVAITHDRVFLERVTTDVVEIGRRYPQGYFRVKGPYSVFVAKRDEFLTGQLRQEESLKNQARAGLAFLRSNVREQRTKSKHLIEKAHATFDSLGEVQARNRPQGAAQIEFQGTGRKSKKLLTAASVGHSLGGKRLFRGVEVELGPGDRLGLVGDNGAGKTTLLKLLGGELSPDEGEVWHADGLRVVRFEQHRDHLLDPDETLFQALATHGDTVRAHGEAIHVQAWAKRFGFAPEQLETRVGALSGGERARVLVANLVRQEADLILLDEPTNDLDLETREVLEEQLLAFPGAVLLVSHDRALLERVCTGLLGIEAGAARLVADYEQWKRFVKSCRQPPPSKASQPKASKAAPEKKPRQRKLTYNEQRELEGMEEQILAAEAELEELQARTEDPQVQADHEAINAAYTRLNETQQEVDRLYARWQELEAIQLGER